MHLENLSLVNFRNYQRAEVEFSKNANLIYGLNAQGKTNLLEAIYLLCLGRSFRSSKNQELLKTDTTFFTIDGKLKLDNNLTRNSILHYVRDGKKEISINGKRLQTHSKIFGEFPIVVMSPDDYKITTGGPSERRRFIDVLLSQVSISYLTNLQEYYRILKQRNKILQKMKEGVRVNDSALMPWTENLISCGSKIVRDRHKFVKNFLTYLGPIYKEYSESDDNIDMSLDSTIAANEVGEQIEEERFKTELEKYRLKEKRLGMSLIGPHRDDIAFEINGKDLRKYGSRGEHKSVLISLKIAEFNFLREAKQETPIFLLDDYYSELDDLREERVFLSLEDLGQVFLTSPKKQVLTEHSKYFDRFGDIRQFEIEDGEIELLGQ